MVNAGVENQRDPVLLSGLPGDIMLKAQLVRHEAPPSWQDHASTGTTPPPCLLHSQGCPITSPVPCGLSGLPHPHWTRARSSSLVLPPRAPLPETQKAGS